MSKANNPFGLKGNKGGAHKRKNFIAIDFSNFAAYAEELDNLGADLEKIFNGVMEREARTVQEDTIEALNHSNLPARGLYSIGKTKQSVDTSPKVQWIGSIGEIGLGFDKTKPGAGGWLITGTPRMRPDYALEKIYSQKKYERQINKSVMDHLQAEIDNRLGG